MDSWKNPSAKLLVCFNSHYKQGNPQILLKPGAGLRYISTLMLITEKENFPEQRMLILNEMTWITRAIKTLLLIPSPLKNIRSHRSSFIFTFHNRIIHKKTRQSTKGWGEKESQIKSILVISLIRIKRFLSIPVFTSGKSYSAESLIFKAQILQVWDILKYSLLRHYCW